MNRMHLLLRLFVLATMTLSFGESVWASTCASMSTIAVADSAAGNGVMSDMPGTPDMPGMPADGDERDGEDDPSCPLGPAAVAQGCLTAASLPASSAESFAVRDERTADIDFVATADELLYGATLFHPPRA